MLRLWYLFKGIIYMDPNDSSPDLLAVLLRLSSRFSLYFVRNISKTFK